MTPLRQHLARWQGGCGSDICPTAHNRVFCRGRVPADIVFTGEAPGSTEDVAAQPFVGPAGQLLDRIVAAAVPAAFRVAYCNLVACIPLDDGAKGAPSIEAVHACRPRLVEFLTLCRPRLIVAVGAMARDELDPKLMGGVKLPWPVKMVPVMHPAAILRQNTSVQGLNIQRCVVQIAAAVEELGVTP